MPSWSGFGNVWMARTSVPDAIITHAALPDRVSLQGLGCAVSVHRQPLAGVHG